MMRKKLILYSAIVIVLCVAGYVEFLRGGPAPVPFRFDTVSTGSIKTTVITTGTLSPVADITVGTQVSGTIAHLYADFNSEVKKGDVIAQIDSTFLAETVRQAAEVLEQARADRDLSEEKYEREKALHERGLDAQQTYDSALTVKETNDAAFRSAEAAYNEAKTNLGYTTIRAPISGVVVDRPVNVGQTVAASYSAPTLFTIANDLHQMQVECTVEESDIGMIAVGQPATFTVDAYPNLQFPGTVTQIRLDPQTIQNVVTYTVVISVKNDQLKLMPGMTANVEIQVASVDNCLRVPNMALRFRPDPELVDSSAINNAAVPSQRNIAQGTHGSQNAPARPLPVVETVHPPSAESFGIIERYPEIEKTGAADNPATQGRVWIVGPKGKLVPVAVVGGVTDGRYTQVTGSSLKAGEQIVVGLNFNDSGSERAQSPFTSSSAPRGRFGVFR